MKRLEVSGAVRPHVRIVRRQRVHGCEWHSAAPQPVCDCTILHTARPTDLLIAQISSNAFPTIPAANCRPCAAVLLNPNATSW